jgi:hypothetical protein
VEVKNKIKTQKKKKDVINPKIFKDIFVNFSAKIFFLKKEVTIPC